MYDKIRDAFRGMASKFAKTKKRTILFAPLDSLGHINSLVSIANHLKSQGHRTIFLFTEPIVNNLKDKGHEVYDCTTADLSESAQTSDTAQDKWNEIIRESRPYWQAADVAANIEFEVKVGFGQMVKDIQKYNDNVAKKLELLKPDILVIDHYFGTPALFLSNLPWVRVFSATPLGIHDNQDLPEAWLGLPTKWEKNEENLAKVARVKKAKKDLYDSYNSYWKSFGLDDLPTDPIQYIPRSPYLNIYMYPQELDYETSPKSWTRCDSIIRDPKAKSFQLPEKLRDKPGKLIFLSLGSLASAETDLMKRLTSILSECPHKFIVCKGPLHDTYDLPSNMWGEKFVPQLEVLSSIDLIITHGGNNTITESFFFGVPGFIVCPLFGDQFDNATRLEELGLGKRIDPYNCTKEELLGAIEHILNKEDIKPKMQAIKQRMQKSEARNKAVKLFDEFVKKH